MGSKTQYRHRVRCNRCGKRATLKKKPVRLDFISCEVCGGNVHSCEASRRKEMEKRDTCYCNHIPFPHMKGTILGCEHHSKHPDTWTEEEDRQYQSMLETKRSG